MLIPYTFKLGPMEYRVKQLPELRGQAKGWWYPYNGVIHIATHRMGRQRPQRQKVHTFWHETVHAILHDMGNHALRDDEKFVDAFAKRLTQIVYTARVV